jgi:hypothetical protein
MERDASARFLDGNHEREGEEGGPQESIAELAPDLRVRSDAAGIVITRAGNQARAKDLQKPEGTPFGDGRDS